jgi:transglutaminase-like putative cysteine protease
MKSLLLPILASFFLCLASNSFARPDATAMDKASQLESQGHFKEAAAVLSAALKENSIAAVDRKKIEFEIDRLERIRKDFPFTKNSLFEALKTSVKGLTQDEFDAWVKEGRFDTREIDGERKFMGSSVSNLYFRYPELSSRRTPPKDSKALEQRRWESCTAIRKTARELNTPYVLPKRFHVNMAVTANADAAPPGEIIRAWLPIPRQYPFTTDFELTSSSPSIKQLAPEQSPIRSVFMEKSAVKGKPTQFKIEYDYTAHGVSFDIKPEVVKPTTPNDPALQPFVQEAPHIVFTPELRELSQKIAGDEQNPYLKAKKFYDWIAENIKYSYAIEYSTIRNIGDYCRSKGYGDCGQEALLFISLCRLNGIPARWQTGWNTFSGDKTIHDWSEIYLAPYGWMPVDPYMGIFAMRYATSLPTEKRKDIRDFYFGGLDQYRIAANSAHNQSLDPPKQSMRSDDVDFQRGELEWGDHNIYFDQYKYELTIKELPIKTAP